MLITHNAINLERPSLLSRRMVEEKKRERLNLSAHEAKMLEGIKNELDLNGDEENSALTKTKKKKKHGVNPLSMKTKRKKVHSTRESIVAEEKVPRKKRRRTRQLRNSSHLKEHLKELQKTFSIREFFHSK